MHIFRVVNNNFTLHMGKVFTDLVSLSQDYISSTVLADVHRDLQKAPFVKPQVGKSIV